MDINATSGQIVDAAIRVHSSLGPGLLESVYEKCLQHELQRRGLDVKTQVGFPIVYGDIRIESGLKIDLLVNDQVIVELKSVDQSIVVGSRVSNHLLLEDHRKKTGAIDQLQRRPAKRRHQTFRQQTLNLPLCELCESSASLR